MIHNIQILQEVSVAEQNLALVNAAREDYLIEEHRRGKHPWGSMRRDCPLCQQGK